jgi:UDP-N-acetylmuramoylalanine--D-glutamate ligase
LEVSSYQLDLLSSLVFNVAALLNITPDHLDRHGGMEGYINAKKRVFVGQRATNTAVIGVDTDITKKIWQDLRKGDSRYTWQGAGQKVVGVSTKKQVAEGLLIHAGIIEDAAASSKLDINGIPSLLGEHNWQNAGVAYAICRALNMVPLDILAGMKSFSGLAYRMKLAGKQGEVRFVNDSKATNAEATENALKAFDDIYWILGGKAKEGGIDSLTGYFPKIKKAYLMGEAAPAFAKVLEVNHVPFQQCGTLSNAFSEASEAALKEGKGLVLLSPACASFDQFRSFEHRGDVFQSLVDGLLSSANNKQIA